MNTVKKPRNFGFEAICIIPKETPPPDSWWVGLDRAAFTAMAGQRAKAMRSARENAHVPYRVLQ